ncbi:MAG: hypothetical protein Tsb0013_15080 [Phycisphaerales bacterium]
MKRTRRAILLIDLLVAMAIIGVVLLGVVPMLRSDAPLQLVAGSTMLAADIEYAQSRTLASPSDPTVVAFRDDGTGYWLARLSDPLVPIADPDGEAWDRVFGDGVAAQLGGCSLTAHNLTRLPDDGPLVIVFDSFGRLEQDDDLAGVLVNSAGEQVIHVRAATGTVSILSALPDAMAPAQPAGGDVKVVEEIGGDALRLGG